MRRKRILREGERKERGRGEEDNEKRGKRGGERERMREREE